MAPDQLHPTVAAMLAPFQLEVPRVAPRTPSAPLPNVPLAWMHYPLTASCEQCGDPITSDMTLCDPCGIADALGPDALAEARGMR